jgi:hypothetical protein
LRTGFAIGRILRLALLAAVVGAPISGAAVAQERPMEPADPLFDLDWSVALRGGYISDASRGGSAFATVAPKVEFTTQGESSSTTLGADAVLAVEDPGEARLGLAHTRAATRLGVGENTVLDGSVDLTYEQLASTDNDLPVNTAVAPYELTGEAAGSAATRLGAFDLTARTGVRRFIDGPSTLDDGTVVDNASQSYWRAGGGLRAGFRLTPLVSVFADGNITAQRFDAPSTALLVPLDNRVYELRAGATFSPNPLINAEFSAGRAWLDYADASLSDASGWVYDANVEFKPDDTITLSAGLMTSIGPSDTVAGDTDVDYALTASAGYAVNPWLLLRGTAGWTGTQTLAAGAFKSGYSAGAGFDLTSSEHTVWSADYVFTHDDADTHALSVGLTIKR